MLLKINMQSLNRLKKTFEDYASLKISFERYEHEIQSFMKFSKSQTENEKKVEIDYTEKGNLAKFRIDVSTAIIANVLQRYLDNQINIKELENWANTLTMDDDHFSLADKEPSTRKNPAIEILYEIANWPETMSSQKILTYILKIKENS